MYQLGYVNCFDVGLKGSPVLWPPGKPNNSFQQVLCPVRPTETSTWWKAPELVNKKCIIFHQDNVRPHVFLYGNTTIAWMGISDSSAVFTRHHTFRFPFIYKIFSGKISDPWKSVKGTCNSSLLKKIKSFGKTELWSCLKNGRRQQNKAVNTFNKVLGKNEKFVFYFSLKTEGTFWP